jgi:hypothetical protein
MKRNSQKLLIRQRENLASDRTRRGCCRWWPALLVENSREVILPCLSIRVKRLSSCLGLHVQSERESMSVSLCVGRAMSLHLCFCNLHATHRRTRLVAGISLGTRRLAAHGCVHRFEREPTCVCCSGGVRGWHAANDPWHERKYPAGVQSLVVVALHQPCCVVCVV